MGTVRRRRVLCAMALIAWGKTAVAGRALPLRVALRQPLRAFSAPAAVPGFFEWRQTEVRPEEFEDSLRLIKAYSVVGKKPLGMWSTDIGESTTRLFHLYHWTDFNERDEAQAAFRQSPGAGCLQENWRRRVVQESSSIFAEATPTLTAVGLPGMLEYAARASQPQGNASVYPVVYELRTYQLKLGYSTVPSFLELYKVGLEDKLAADESGMSELVSLLYSEAGAAPLNIVIEVWRHKSLHGSQVSRVASRGAPKWRKAVGDIAELAVTFTTQYVRPLEGSTLQ